MILANFNALNLFFFNNFSCIFITNSNRNALINWNHGVLEICLIFNCVISGAKKWIVASLQKWQNHHQLRSPGWIPLIPLGVVIKGEGLTMHLLKKWWYVLLSSYLFTSLYFLPYKNHICLTLPLTSVHIITKGNTIQNRMSYIEDLL